MENLLFSGTSPHIFQGKKRKKKERRSLKPLRTFTVEEQLLFAQIEERERDTYIPCSISHQRYIFPQPFFVKMKCVLALFVLSALCLASSSANPLWTSRKVLYSKPIELKPREPSR